MKHLTNLLAGALGLAAAVTPQDRAGAAPAPLIASPPAWVIAAPAPSIEKPEIQKLPIAVLLNDTQLNFDGDGWSEYHMLRAKVQAPAGLQGLSAIPFEWSPWSDTLTFHSARILRGDDTIDILPKNAAFTIIRRETGLEQGLLTGVLTAVIQPDSLQVGDVLEVSLSIRHSDPLLKGAVGALIANWDLAPLVHMRLHARWPSALPMRWRESTYLPAFQKVEAKGMTEVSFDLDDVRPKILPAQAPVRFLHGRQIEFTSLADWGAVAGLMAPLFANAADVAPQSAVAEQARLIAAKSKDPKTRAALALQLVQEQVRYLAHNEDARGYTPQSAEETWRLRSGDCKAKTVLLIALLKQLGIPATPALASLAVGDGLNEHLPLIQLMDHVVVRVHLEGRDYWLDGTRQGDRSLAELTTYPYGWVLPLDGVHLVHVSPSPATKPLVTQIIRYDASKGPAAPEPTNLKTILRGDGAALLHTKFSSLPPEQLEAALRAYWSAIHSRFTPSHVSANWDEEKGEETLTAEGESALDWTSSGLELQHVEFGGAPNLNRDPASIVPDAPYVVTFPFYEETDESVVMPPGSKLPRHAVGAADVDVIIAGVAYRRASSVEGTTIRVVSSRRSLQPEISATEARASVAPLTKLGDEGVFIPSTLMPKTLADAAIIDSRPTTLEEHLSRGLALLDAERYKEALAEANIATGLAPTSQQAWAARAIAHAWLRDPAAKDDADKADALGPPDIVAARARAQLAYLSGDYDAARVGFQHALSIRPDDDFSLYRLISIELSSANTEAARKYVEQLRTTHPEAEFYVHLNEAAIDHLLRDKAGADRELALAVPATDEEKIQRAEGYLQIGDKDLALAEAKAAVRQNPTVDGYLFLAKLDDGAAADEDLEAALKLDPKNLTARIAQVNRATHMSRYSAALTLMNSLIADHPEFSGAFWIWRAQIEQSVGLRAEEDADFLRAENAVGETAPNAAALCNAEFLAKWRPETAVKNCDKALKVSSKSISLLVEKTILLSRLGRSAEEKVALKAAEDESHRPDDLNSLCYSLATENIELDRALAACETAAHLEPKSSAILDSRAFTLMRLGRNAEAIKAYDQVLEINPKEYASRYGRALVEARLGLRDQSARDMADVMAARPKLREEFEKIGVRD